MGCLNYKQEFSHWFGNIHLSGPCNRSCPFCIGQHMLALDPYNSLGVWPLTNLDKFIEECSKRDIKEINLTGSNTDPLLFRNLTPYIKYMRERIPNCILGIRTNGVAINIHKANYLSEFFLFDKASISITSFDQDIYVKTMGNGRPPNLDDIFLKWQSLKQDKKTELFDIKINIVLCPELIDGTVGERDLDKTLKKLSYLSEFGLKRVNVRRAYGQPALKNPFNHIQPEKYILGNPSYKIHDCLEVTLWDVHYTEVQSVNLYANGIVSIDYPVTLGHHPSGEVKGPEKWLTWGRKNKQWLKYEHNSTS